MDRQPKLTILYEKMRGRVFILDKEVLTAGRKDDTDICIKDGSLSSHHCEFIRQENGSYLLRDNDSTNGSRVNNEPINEKLLQNSDIIQLGAVEMLYDCEDGDATNTTNERTHTIDISSADLNFGAKKELPAMSPFALSEKKKQEQQHKMMIAILILCAILVVLLIGYFVYKVFFSSN